MSERIGLVAAGVRRIEYARSVLAYLSGVFSGSTDEGLPATTCRELKDALDAWLESHEVTALDYLAPKPQDEPPPPQYRETSNGPFEPTSLRELPAETDDEGLPL